MAGIGDEIGMGAADVGLCGAVARLDHPKAGIDRAARQLPQAAAAGQAANAGRCAFIIGLSKRRMASG
jgi:hypothetical protein